MKALWTQEWNTYDPFPLAEPSRMICAISKWDDAPAPAHTAQIDHGG